MITKEHILQAKKDTIQIFDDLLANFEPEGLHHFAGSRLPDGTIQTDWEGKPENKIDIQFQLEGNDKWHSIQWMIEDDKDADDFDYNPPFLDNTMNGYDFTIPPEKPVNVRLFDGEEMVGELSFEAIDETEPEPKPEPKNLLTTLWDSSEANFDSGFNAVRTRRINDLRKMEGSEKMVIHSLSHSWTEKDPNGNTILEQEWRWESELKGFAKELSRLSGYNETNFKLFLQDEAMGKKHWGETPEEKVENLERLLSIARKHLPDWLEIGISETRGAFNDGRIAKGFDFYCEPCYYFFRKDLEQYGQGYFAIENREQFDERFDIEMKITKKLIGGADLYLIGQGFENTGNENDPEYQRRWRKPPIWYVQAIYENCAKHNIKGVWWWLLKTNKKRNVKGLEDMPDLYSEIKSVSKKYS